MDEELKKIIEYIEKNYPGYEIKFVHSWTELGGNVDSCLFDSYEEATNVVRRTGGEDYIKILPVIVGIHA